MIEKNRRHFCVSSDKSKLDLGMIHRFLAGSYWAEGISMEAVETSVKNSLCFGLYDDLKQVGFGRVITDYAVLAFLGDVFVLEEYRGIGLGKMLVEHILSYPSLLGIRGWLLATRDAHDLYEKYGFRVHPNPGRFMVRRGDT